MKRLKRNCGGGAGLGLTRLLALFVVIAMAVGIMPTVALAEEPDYVHYYIKNVSTKQVLQSNGHGNIINFVEPSSAENQSWIITPIADVRAAKNLDAANGLDNCYYISIGEVTDGTASMEVVVINGGGNSDRTGATLVEWDLMAKDDQNSTTDIWKIVPVEGDSNSGFKYKILSAHSGLCIDVINGTPALNVYTGLDTQKWAFEQVSGTTPTTFSTVVDESKTELKNTVYIPTVSSELDELVKNANGPVSDLAITGSINKPNDYMYGPTAELTGKENATNGKELGGTYYALNVADADNTMNATYLKGRVPDQQTVWHDVTMKTDSSDYFIYEFVPTYVNSASSGEMGSEIGFRDSAGKLIGAFRMGVPGNSEFSPYYVHHGGNGNNYLEPEDFPIVETENNHEIKSVAGASNKNTLIRMVVLNLKSDDDNNGSHAVRFYWRKPYDADSKWTLFYEAKYNGVVGPLAKIEDRNIYFNGGTLNDKNAEGMGFGNFKAYAGNYINGSTKIDSVTTEQNVVPTLQPKTDEGNDIIWGYADYSTDGKRVTVHGVVLQTGEAVTAEVMVGKRNLSKHLTHYYDFDSAAEGTTVKNAGTTSAAGDGVLNEDAKIYEGKLLINRNDRGKTDYMKINNAVVTDDQTEVTIAAFFRPSINQQSNPLFGFGADDHRRAFYNPNTNNGQFFEVRANDGWNGTDYSGFNFSSSALANKWHHIAIVVKDNQVITYSDGVSVGENTFSLNQTVINCMKGTENYIGVSGYSSGIPNSFTGFIDDFRVYNIALSDDEIATLAGDRPEEDNDLITVSAPELNVVKDAGESDANVDDLYMEYKVDFSDVKESVADICNRTLYYSVTVNQFDADSKEPTVVGDAQTVTVDDNGIATVGIVPKNPNVIYGISASVTVDNEQKNGQDAYASIDANIANATTLYEEVLKDLANSNYQQGDSLDPARLASANTVIGLGGLAGIADLQGLQNQIMTAEGNTVTINTPFKELGIGFKYSADKLYVGDIAVTGYADGTVYRQLTLADGKVTLSDPFDATGQEAITLSLDAVQIEFVETLIESLEAENAGSEADFIPEL